MCALEAQPMCAYVRDRVCVGKGACVLDDATVYVFVK